MGYIIDEKFEDYNEKELVDRALSEMNEEYPWRSIVKKCLLLLKKKLEEK